VASKPAKEVMAMDMDDRRGWAYAGEPHAGCVYRHAHVTEAEAGVLTRRGEVPHVVELMADAGGGCELRLHYCLDLHQAAAKAAEILVRMFGQGLLVRLAAIRPATGDETEAFFTELEKHDGLRRGAVNRCRL
jgi:hypothetical protein